MSFSRSRGMPYGGGVPMGGGFSSVVGGFAPQQQMIQQAPMSYGAPIASVGYGGGGYGGSVQSYAQPMQQTYAQPMQQTYAQPMQQTYAQPMQQTYGGGGFTSVRGGAVGGAYGGGYGGGFGSVV